MEFGYVKIAGTMYDRRRKLTESQKELMRLIRETEGISLQKLGDMFGVSKRTAEFICFPERRAKSDAQLRVRMKDGRYRPSRDEHSERERDLRKYKRRLMEEGKI